MIGRPPLYLQSFEFEELHSRNLVETAPEEALFKFHAHAARLPSPAAAAVILILDSRSPVLMRAAAVVRSRFRFGAAAAAVRQLFIVRQTPD